MYSIRSLRQLTDEQLERIGLEYGEIGELKLELEATSHGRYSRIWHSSSFFSIQKTPPSCHCAESKNATVTIVTHYHCN